ncbi:FAD:protein FMN transferase [Parasulfuritortus cantonensis]|uniref:FAD:protein FMN transferase n=1 Tax=Parasulfuritortus cantonensis TaxID=2528202 RepID=UPI0019800652|nr:FAD:protein FMN transferase [Parasulfuritortus cantonensis]
MIRRLSAWLALACLAVLLAACAEKPPYKQEAYVFGTLVQVSVYGAPEDRARPAVAAVLADFDRLHRLLHAWEPSDLQRINAAIAAGRASEPAPAEVIGLLRDAADWSARSDGLFNPAIGNLIELWGFHADTFAARLPDPAKVAELVQANPGMADLSYVDGRVASRNPAVRLDLGGYAKGYALERAAGILQAHGVRNALINIGGNILALGQHGSRPWKVGIQHPRQSGAIATLELRDGEAIGTSGDYQRYFEVAGKRYCHLIDPRTGWPATGAQAVTVLVRGAHAGTRSDVTSKPMFIAGPDAWRPMARRMGVDDVLFIDARGRASATRSMAARLEWLDQTAPLAVVE